MSKDDQPRRRRFVIAFLPFSSICRSRSSVDTTARRAGKKPHHQGSGSSSGAAAGGGGAPGKKGDETLVARLLRGFKNLSSQIFAVYDENEDEEEEEEEEREMVIGLPTDVKHVAHMGWDGSTSTATSLRSWNNNARAAPQQQQPALSVRQFELAMAAQAVAVTDTTAGGHRRRS